MTRLLLGMVATDEATCRCSERTMPASDIVAGGSADDRPFDAAFRVRGGSRHRRADADHCTDAHVSLTFRMPKDTGCITFGAAAFSGSMSHQSSALAATVRGGATAHPPRVRHALYGPTPGCGTATPDGRYSWICPSSVCRRGWSPSRSSNPGSACPSARSRSTRKSGVVCSR